MHVLYLLFARIFVTICVNEKGEVMFPLDEINLSGEVATDFAMLLLELNKQLILVKGMSSEKLRKNDLNKNEMLPKLFDSFYVQKNAQDFSPVFYSKRLSEMSQSILISCEKEIQTIFASHNCMLFEKRASLAFDDIATFVGKVVAAQKYDREEPATPQRKLEREHHNLLTLAKKLKEKVNEKFFAQLKRIVLGKNETEKLYLAVNKNKNPESESFDKYIKQTYQKKVKELKDLRQQYYEKMVFFKVGQAEQIAYAKLKKEFPKERKHVVVPIDGQASMFDN